MGKCKQANEFQSRHYGHPTLIIHKQARFTIQGSPTLNKLLKPFFQIRQSKVALSQTLILKLGVTLVLTVTQGYAFINPAERLPRHLKHRAEFMFIELMFIAKSMNIVHDLATLSTALEFSVQRVMLTIPSFNNGPPELVPWNVTLA